MRVSAAVHVKVERGFPKIPETCRARSFRMPATGGKISQGMPSAVAHYPENIRLLSIEAVEIKFPNIGLAIPVAWWRRPVQERWLWGHAAWLSPNRSGRSAPLEISPPVARSMATANSAETRPARLALQIAFWETPAASPSFFSEPAWAMAFSISGRMASGSIAHIANTLLCTWQHKFVSLGLLLIQHESMLNGAFINHGKFTRRDRLTWTMARP